jgi:phosphatidate cytidylyltransferase
MSNSLLRILTALVGIPVVLGAAYLGGWPFAVVVGGIALVGQQELYGMMEKGGMRPHRKAGSVMGALLVTRPMNPFELDLAVGLALTFFLGYLAYTTFFDDDDRAPLPNLSGTLFGVIYPPAVLATLLDLRQIGGETHDHEAFLVVLAAFVLIWLTDTSAYYVGKNLGRRSLAPDISPNKTWAGLFGGASGALVGGVALKALLLPFLAWPHLVVVALICGVLSPLGDLTESRFKRSVEVEDSGDILPGHGGLLDRFDALLLAVPLVYLYLEYVARLFST